MTRLTMVSRILAGTLGAYAVTALTTIALARVMRAVGTDPVEAVLGATIASFGVFTALSIAAFHMAPVRAWTWFVTGSISLGLVIMLMPVPS